MDKLFRANSIDDRIRININRLKKNETMVAQLKNILKPEDREVITTASMEFTPYNRYGPDHPTMDWIPLSGNADDGFETFLLKMKPGAQSTPHEHTQREEFLVMEGSMTDCDGTMFTTGDYVKFKPGSTHYSNSKDGCTLLVVLTGQNRQL